MTKILIVGQIGGLKVWVCKAKFEAAFNGLSLLGFEPVNPLTINPSTHQSDSLGTWKWYLKQDLNELKKCKSIFVLNNWEASKQSKILVWVANRLGKTIIYQPSVEASINIKYPVKN